MIVYRHIEIQDNLTDDTNVDQRRCQDKFEGEYISNLSLTGPWSFVLWFFPFLNAKSVINMKAAANADFSKGSYVIVLTLACFRSMQLKLR